MNTTHRNLITVFAFVLSTLCISTGCTQGEKSFVGANGNLSAKGTSLVNEHGEKITLHGISYGWHNAWPRFYNAGSVHTLVTDWDAKVVRCALGLEPFGDFLRNPQRGIDCVTAVVDAAIAEGVYVIIDWHSHVLYKEEAKVFFEAMAEKYQNVPNVIYEIFNEPVDQSWEELKDYATYVIAGIRTHSPNALVLVGCPHWDQDIRKVADAPLEGCGNIMYTVHFYAGTHKKYLRDESDYAISKGIPIFVSECGSMSADGQGAVDYEEWAAWQNWMKANGISCVAWSLSDKDETCSMLLPAATSEGPWSDDVMKEWGILARKTVREAAK